MTEPPTVTEAPPAAPLPDAYASEARRGCRTVLSSDSVVRGITEHLESKGSEGRNYAHVIHGVTIKKLASAIHPLRVVLPRTDDHFGNGIEGKLDFKVRGDAYRTDSEFYTIPHLFPWDHQTPLAFFLECRILDHCKCSQVVTHQTEPWTQVFRKNSAGLYLTVSANP